MNSAKKLILPGAILMAGAIGIAGSSLLTALSANAASSIGASNGASSSSSQAQFDPTTGGHTANGITETVLTGDNATKATAAAQAAVSSATVIRVETDAEGATYEAHMKKSDGTLVTVKMDSNFKVTSTENGMGNMPKNSSGNSAPTSQ